MKKILATFVLSALAATSAQAGLLYAISDSTNTLVSIDTTTLAVTNVGATGVGGDFGGMAYDPTSGTLFWIPGRGNNSLYTLDRTTGAATLVGGHGVDDLFGLEFDTSTGTLYASQFAGGNGFYSLNVTTGAATTINASMGTGIGGLAYDSTRNRLVGIEDGAGNLFEINRATGALSFLGNNGTNDDSGLAYDADTDSYWDIDWRGDLYSYNATTLQRTLRLSGLGSMDGLAYVSDATGPGGNLPEPASLALTGLALAAAAAVRRRKAA